MQRAHEVDALNTRRARTPTTYWGKELEETKKGRQGKRRRGPVLVGVSRGNRVSKAICGKDTKKQNEKHKEGEKRRRNRL